MFKPSDPTCTNHPLRKAMVAAIAFESDCRRACAEDEDPYEVLPVYLAKATNAADYAVMVWKKAVDAYRATPCGEAPSPVSYRPLLRSA